MVFILPIYKESYVVQYIGNVHYVVSHYWKHWLDVPRASSPSLPSERNPASWGWVVHDVSVKRQGILLSFLLSHSLLSEPTFSCATNRAVLEITMSFGFSVGDFIAAIELTNKIRKDFVDAPSQFKAISDEYAVLATFLSNADSVDGTGSEASRLSF
jgi:hypothetical protein